MSNDHSERNIQEALYSRLINITPEDSAHSEHWHRADCDCGWATTGAERICEDAAYDHIADVHMLGLTKVTDVIEADVRRKIADELRAVDPIEWALAGQDAGQIAAAIARGDSGGQA